MNMMLLYLSLSLTTGIMPEVQQPHDLRVLFDTIDVLQQQIQSFKCEYEGDLRFFGKGAENLKGKVDSEGRLMNYSGIFLWKQGGDTHVDSLQRELVSGEVVRDILVIRPRDSRAEHYIRYNNASIGSADIKDPKDLNAWRTGSLGLIFPIDKMKLDATGQGSESSVQDDQLDGRPMKVLTLKIGTVPFRRFWIDLRRNGHVIRQDSYQSEKLVARLEIVLEQFRVGDGSVWMPVSGKNAGFAYKGKNDLVIVSDPTTIESIYVIRKTYEFNVNPVSSAFTVNYKFGTPISDHLRKLETEFGSSNIDARPTKRDAEKMLNEQIVKAEKQKSELVVAPIPPTSNWALWMGLGLGAALVILLIIAWVQRRSY